MSFLDLKSRARVALSFLKTRNIDRFWQGKMTEIGVRAKAAESGFKKDLIASQLIDPFKWTKLNPERTKRRCQCPVSILSKISSSV